MPIVFAPAQAGAVGYGAEGIVEGNKMTADAAYKSAQLNLERQRMEQQGDQAAQSNALKTAEFYAGQQPNQRDKWQAANQVQQSLAINQGQLSQAENMRMQRLQTARSSIDEALGSGQITQEDAAAMRLQVAGLEDPLQHRRAQGQIALQNQAIQRGQQQNQLQQVTADQNRRYNAQVAQRGVAYDIPPAMIPQYQAQARALNPNATPDQLETAVMQMAHEGRNITYSRWNPRTETYDPIPWNDGHPQGNQRGRAGGGVDPGAEPGGETPRGGTGAAQGAGQRLNRQTLLQRAEELHPFVPPGDATPGSAAWNRAYDEHYDKVIEPYMARAERRITPPQAPPAPRPRAYDHRTTTDIDQRRMENTWHNTWQMALRQDPQQQGMAAILRPNLEEASRIHRAFGSEAAMAAHPEALRRYRAAMTNIRSVREQLTGELVPERFGGPQPNQGRGAEAPSGRFPARGSAERNEIEATRRAANRGILGATARTLREGAEELGSGAARGVGRAAEDIGTAAGAVHRNVLKPVGSFFGDVWEGLFGR